MRGQWTQFLILFIAIGAPALSWVFGKLREQAELKKARDAARRQHEESLRATRLAERSPVLSPEDQRERERRDLAARRQAQLRELRQRQHERGPAPGPVLTRAPGAPGGARPTPPRPVGPLRPGVPAPATGRRTPTAAPTPRPAPRRPAPPTARAIPPGLPPTRRSGVPAPAAARVRAPESRPAPLRDSIAATEIGSGRSSDEPARRSRVGADVRGMLVDPDGLPRPREDLARAFALSEVLGAPISLREEGQFSWDRV